MNFDPLKKIFTSIVDFTKKHVIVVSTILTAFMCMYLYVMVLSYGKTASRNFNHKINVIFVKDTIINNNRYTYLYDAFNKTSMIVNPKKTIDIYSFSRIVSQLKEVRQREFMHNRAIDYFIINLYYCIVIQTIFMVLVCILGLIISKKGWGDAGRGLLAAFLVCAGFLLFFKVLPQGMKFEENLASNRAHYIMYCDVENRLLSYLSSDKIIDTFISDMDDQLKNYHSVCFDLQQVPFSEVQKQFKDIKGSSDGESSNSKVYNNYVVSPTSKEKDNTKKLEESLLKSIPPLDSTVVLKDTSDI